MTEHKEKYKELLFDLFAEGFDLVFGSSGENNGMQVFLVIAKKILMASYHIPTQKIKNVKFLVKKKQHLFLREYITTLFVLETN